MVGLVVVVASVAEILALCAAGAGALALVGEGATGLAPTTAAPGVSGGVAADQAAVQETTAALGVLVAGAAVWVPKAAARAAQLAYSFTTDRTTP